MDVAKLPAYVINLERRPDRLRQMKQLMKSLGVEKVRYRKAVDGIALLQKQAGRSVKKPGKLKKYKLTWTDAHTKLRISHMQKLPNQMHAQRGWSIWGMLGRNLSHLAVWTDMVHRGIEVATIWEDDCHLLHSPVQVKKIFKARMAAIERCYPRWCMVHLGGVATNIPGNLRSSASCVEGVAVARTVYQAHCYVLKIDAAVLAYIRAKMVDGGLLVDNAFVSWQRSLFKKRQYRAFWLNGPQLVQQGNFGSDILRATPELGGAAG